MLALDTAHFGRLPGRFFLRVSWRASVEAVTAVLAYIGVGEHGFRTVGAFLRCLFPQGRRIKIICIAVQHALTKHHRANESYADSCSRNIDSYAEEGDHAGSAGDGGSVGADRVQGAQVFVRALNGDKDPGNDTPLQSLTPDALLCHIGGIRPRPRREARRGALPVGRIAAAIWHMLAGPR
jgi:hypothetical protein